MVHSGQARAAPRAERDFDSAATAIVDDQAVASIHFCDEHIGTVRPIRVNGTNTVQIVGHSGATWSRCHAAIWRLPGRESNVRYPTGRPLNRTVCNPSVPFIRDAKIKQTVWKVVNSVVGVSDL